MLKLSIANTDLLDYLAYLQLSHPDKFKTLQEFIAQHSHSCALLNHLSKSYPKILSKASILVHGHKELLRNTLITLKSNVCQVCGEPFWPHKYRLEAGTCSHSCRLAVPEFVSEMIERRNKTSLKNHGTENYAELESVKAKRRATTLARHGCTSSLGAKHLKAKYNSTMLEHWGVSHSSQSHEVKNKVKQTNLERYGFTQASKSPRTKAANKRNLIKKYGVSHVMKLPEVRSNWLNSMYSSKQYVDRKGVTHIVQGYEPQVLYYFDTKGFSLKTKPQSIPVIQYGDNQHYFPDAIVISPSGQRILLEVKSKFTLKSELGLNLKKFAAAKSWCRDNGYTFMLAVSNGKFRSKPTFVANPARGSVEAIS